LNPSNPESEYRRSLRDPEGVLFEIEDRFLRFVRPSGVEALHAALNSELVQKWTDEKNFISSKTLEFSKAKTIFGKVGISLPDAGLVLEHPKVFFPSYPHEWAAEMLYRSGELTLEMAQKLLSDGLGLKDATPLNILFSGPTPVFVDVLSVESRDPKDPTWMPFAQFVRTFMNPLLANKHFGIPLAMTFLTHRDGLEPEEIYQMCGPLKRFSQPFLGMVSIPTWLTRRKKTYDKKIYQKRLVNNPEKAQFITSSLLKRLIRAFKKAAPSKRKSFWSDYMGDDLPYTETAFKEKETFVIEMLQKLKPHSVLDVGCNTGYFSALSAKQGAKVIGIDYDPTVIGLAWQRAVGQKLDFLPLCVDLTRPTPGVGWQNRESKSFLERAENKFDCLLMLAVVHHITVSEGIPLQETVELVSKITKRALILEYIDPSDETFQGLTRGREELYKDLTPERFETLFGNRFHVVEKRPTSRPTRIMYLLEKRS